MHEYVTLSIFPYVWTELYDSTLLTFQVTVLKLLLKMVPTIVGVCMFCASRKAWFTPCVR